MNMYRDNLPIIIVQDANNDPISTTQDVLNQLELVKYSSHLKGIDLSQFMQMTDEKDFQKFGIRKQKDCQKLCSTAQSIRRSSIDSSIFTTDEEIDYPSEEEVEWPNSIARPLEAQPRRLSLPAYSSPAEEIDKKRRYSYHALEEEVLPTYSCTLHKLGKAKAKIEYQSPGKRTRRRPWRDVYMELKGTMLRLYEQKDNNGRYHYLPTLTAYYQQSITYTRLLDLSLAYAKVDHADDYTKRSNVFRIQTASGPQVLFQVQTNAAVSLWIEKIMTGKQVSL
ncbi:Pleckstrin homology domain-containing protein [Gilbertella persicaria]|uniref:Pleckstrin homology domain-containing protein n=1 Tax=Gilbertella persicaria TaxID=101096 RepID=UPI0022200C13|nr:Pleckstrin homology domain-containing protein [Gilbertella persicaria]KAI8090190.1 Pleckstrin homology domain-containing protein [Gilbertella persicaria]